MAINIYIFALLKAEEIGGDIKKDKHWRIFLRLFCLCWGDIERVERRRVIERDQYPSWHRTQSHRDT